MSYLALAIASLSRYYQLAVKALVVSKKQEKDKIQLLAVSR